MSRPKENAISLFENEVNLKLSHHHLVNPNDCLTSHYHVSFSTHQSKGQRTTLKVAQQTLEIAYHRDLKISLL